MFMNFYNAFVYEPTSNRTEAFLRTQFLFILKNSDIGQTWRKTDTWQVNTSRSNYNLSIAMRNVLIPLQTIVSTTHTVDKLQRFQRSWLVIRVNCFWRLAWLIIALRSPKIFKYSGGETSTVQRSREWSEWADGEQVYSHALIFAGLWQSGKEYNFWSLLAENLPADRCNFIPSNWIYNACRSILPSCLRALCP